MVCVYTAHTRFQFEQPTDQVEATESDALVSLIEAFESCASCDAALTEGALPEGAEY